jgi:hypothetical protein
MDSIVTSTRTKQGKTYSLSASLARRDPKGLGVLFDLRAYTGFLVRLRFADAAFAVERVVGRTTEPLPADVRLDFLTEAAVRDPRHVLAPVVSAIPAEALGYVARLREHQLHAFRVFAGCLSAVDLVRSSPRLLWVLVAISAERGTPMDEIRAVLGSRRHEVLGWCGGVPTKAAVRYLERRTIETFDDDELHRVLRECASPAVIRDTAHVALPDEGSAVFSLDHPELLESEVGRRAVDPETRTISATQIWMLWRDTLRMSHEAVRPEIQNRLRSCRTVEGLWRLHDEVLVAFHERQAPQSEPKHRRLPPPPLEGSAEIQPLTLTTLVEIEGRLMRHCCRSYVEDVRQGRSYLYRVLSPERATLELDLTGAEPCVAQLKLARNGQPSQATFATVASWLARRLAERRSEQHGPS